VSSFKLVCYIYPFTCWDTWIKTDWQKQVNGDRCQCHGVSCSLYWEQCVSCWLLTSMCVYGFLLPESGVCVCGYVWKESHYLFEILHLDLRSFFPLAKRVCVLNIGVSCSSSFLSREREGRLRIVNMCKPVGVAPGRWRGSLSFWIWLAVGFRSGDGSWDSFNPNLLICGDVREEREVNAGE